MMNGPVMDQNREPEARPKYTCHDKSNLGPILVTQGMAVWYWIKLEPLANPTSYFYIDDVFVPASEKKKT